MQNRTIISKQELADLFKAETRNLDIFKSVYIQPENTEPDETGCNWYINYSNGESEVIHKCAETLQELNTSLHAKYNLPPD